MELRHLRYFVAVAEELHFGRAARRLHMAQPPLSQQIRALEEELGLPLFRRTSRKVELTRAGLGFLEQARLTLAQAARAIDVARAVARGEAGRITVSFVTSAIYTIVPAILREFHLRRPEVELRCMELAPKRQLEALHHHEVDVAFVRMQVQDDSLKSQLLFKETLILALPVDHPLAPAAESKVRLADFAQTPFIMLPPDRAPTFHDLVTDACRQAGFSPRVTQEAGEMQAVLGLVAAGLGVALVPRSLRHLRRPDVTYRELARRTGEVPLLVVWRRNSTEPLVEAFVAAAREVAARGDAPDLAPDAAADGPS